MMDELMVPTPRKPSLAGSSDIEEKERDTARTADRENIVMEEVPLAMMMSGVQEGVRNVEKGQNWQKFQ